MSEVLRKFGLFLLFSHNDKSSKMDKKNIGIWLKYEQQNGYLHVLFMSEQRSLHQTVT